MIEEILKNKTIKDFKISENSLCTLHFSDGFCLSTKALVRFVGNNNDTFICSNDHGHQFGLNQSINFEEDLKKIIQNCCIEDIKINSQTGDVGLFLKDGVIEIISTSKGYENYQLNGPGNLTIVGYGGKQKPNS